MSNNGSSKEEANLKQNRSPKTIEKNLIMVIWEHFCAVSIKRLDLGKTTEEYEIENDSAVKIHEYLYQKLIHDT